MGSSFFGRYVSFCMYRYGISLSEFFSGAFSQAIYAYVRSLYVDYVTLSAEFLAEAIELRDGSLELADSHGALNRGEVNDIIDFICVN